MLAVLSCLASHPAGIDRKTMRAAKSVYNDKTLNKG